MTLIKKLTQVYAKVDHVEKRGVNQKQGYKFIRSADMLHAIRNEFAALGVYAETNFELLGTYDIATNSGGKMHTATVRATIVLHDTDTDEKLTVSGLGDGADSGDKGIYKAQTGAIKNALRNAFLVPDEEDPEADEAVDTATSVVEPNKPRVGRPPKAVQNTQSVQAAPKAEVKSEIKPEARNTGEPVTLKTATINAGSLPTESEFDQFVERTGVLIDRLQKAGLATKRTRSAGKRVGGYLRAITQKDDLTLITKDEWTSFFTLTDQVLAGENGEQALITQIESLEKN